ncbi:DUF3515 domain-containing protein [Streptomyces sp. DSM 44915]|uniref:DUF3515 domain-containing protein n=1 Tax=Streptomyces chisholmiae TaxID=3075540 RepID=A0ABU2JX90_9ACTN|nr:DUF3515 domain-containing protein [Streptomyces sp. DSM 44915]MDT0269368.1 DUF3515 domain-containing protein [Streptomyces sp. DSM 44915]
MTSTVRRALPATAAVLLLAACSSASGAPEVEVPEPRGEAADVCRALAEDLPEVVDGQERGELAEETPFAAVWGSPGIVLRCGVPTPAQLDPASDAYDPVYADVVGVNEVSWLLEEEADGIRFTTTERTVPVEMTVPDAYAPEVNPLLDVAEAIDRHVPLDELYQRDETDETDETNEDGTGGGDPGHQH